MNQVDEKLLKAAGELVKAAHKAIDDAMPGRLASIVKIHAALGVGAAWVPIPGVGIAGGIAAIWGMYYRINKELDMPFQENVLKSVASGVGTNLAAYTGIVTVGEALKLIPGIGSLAGAVVMSAAAYALTLGSGYVYMKVLTLVLTQKKANDISESDLKSAVEQVMSDKESMKSFVNEARKSYKDTDVAAQGREGIPEPTQAVERPLPVAQAVISEEPVSAPISDTMIRFLCPGCGKRLKAPPAKSGRRGTCTACRQKLIIPESS